MKDVKVRGAAAPKERMTYAEYRGWDLSYDAGIKAIRLGLKPFGLGWSLRAGVLAWWLELEPKGWDWSFHAGIAQCSGSHHHK